MLLNNLPADIEAQAHARCRATLVDAVDDLVKRGFERVVVVSSMMTPGGAHSDVDVPREIEGLSWRFPDLDIEYAWPFDTESVAALLALHLKSTARLVRP